MKIESDIILFTGTCGRTQTWSGFKVTYMHRCSLKLPYRFFFSSLENVPLKWGRVGDTFEFISLSDLSSVYMKRESSVYVIWVLSEGSEQWWAHPEKSLPHLRLMLRQGDTNPLFFPFFLSNLLTVLWDWSCATEVCIPLLAFQSTLAVSEFPFN